MCHFSGQNTHAQLHSINKKNIYTRAQIKEHAHAHATLLPLSLLLAEYLLGMCVRACVSVCTPGDAATPRRSGQKKNACAHASTGQRWDPPIKPLTRGPSFFWCLCVCVSELVSGWVVLVRGRVASGFGVCCVYGLGHPHIYTLTAQVYVCVRVRPYIELSIDQSISYTRVSMFACVCVNT